MHEEVQALIDSIRNGNGNLELTVKIQEGESFASLDIDRRALDPVLFVGGVAEFIYSYITHLTRDPEYTHYPEAAFTDFEREFLNRNIRIRSSWVDLIENHSEFYNSAFRGWFRRRKPGTGIAASTETLRLELVAISKENPTVLKILATGTVGALSLFVVLVGGLGAYQQYGAEACRQQAYSYAEQSREMVHESIKQQGRETDIHELSLSKIDNTLKAGISACNGEMGNIRIRLKIPNGVIFDAEAEDLRRKDI